MAIFVQLWFFFSFMEGKCLLHLNLSSFTLKIRPFYLLRIRDFCFSIQAYDHPGWDFSTINATKQGVCGILLRRWLEEKLKKSRKFSCFFMVIYNGLTSIEKSPKKQTTVLDSFRSLLQIGLSVAPLVVLPGALESSQDAKRVPT